MTARHLLSALSVKNAPAGKYCDGAGLWLVKRDAVHGKWVLRTTVYGRRREMGLGSLSQVSLKQARELADRWRSVAASGKDPIKERTASARAQARADTTLSLIAKEAFEARKAELKGDGIAGRWFSPLELHVLPKLGKTPIEEIDQRDIKDVLAPIWHTKADTARKALNRIGIVFRHAAAMGLTVDLQATEKAKALLGATRHVVTHIEAVPWKEVPAFYASLAEPSITHLALRLLILTAGTRSKPLRFLRFDQIEGDVWTIEGEDMKGRKGKTPDFTVPLSTAALEVIELARPFTRDGYVFPSVRKGVISDATMSRLMERRGMAARPHGFRASFRTWLDEATDYPFELKEACLAHSVGTAVSRSYIRTDNIEKRHEIMERWAAHVTGRAIRTGPDPEK